MTALQRRRTTGRDLQSVEAAPALADHPDLAGAPGLGRDPGDHLERVVLLLPQILVERARRRIRRCRACRRGSRRSRGRRNRGASPRRARRYRRACSRGCTRGSPAPDSPGVIGQPVAAGEPGAVGERDPGVVDLADGVRELGRIDDPRGLLVHAQWPSRGGAHHHAASGKWQRTVRPSAVRCGAGTRCGSAPARTGSGGGTRSPWAGRSRLGTSPSIETSARAPGRDPAAARPRAGRCV